MMFHLTYVAASVSILAVCGSCSVGPPIAIDQSSEGFVIRDSEFNIVKELKDPQQITFLRNAMHRAKRVGDTRTKLKRSTYKIDGEHRWLIDLESGEFGVLSMVVRDVYQLETQDLKMLKGLLQTKPEPTADNNQ